MRAVRGKGVDELPAIRLLFVGQTVAVGVLAVGVSVQPEFLGVGETVGVGIKEGGVAAVLELKEVGQAVAVAVPPAIVWVRSTIHAVEQAVAVEVLLSPKCQIAGLSPGKTVAAVLADGLVEVVQSGREDVKGEGLPYVHVAGAPFGADVADRHETQVGDIRGDSTHRVDDVGNNETLLGGDGIALRQVQRRLAVNAGLAEGDAAAEGSWRYVELFVVAGRLPGVAGGVLFVAVNEVLAVLIHVQVLLLGLPLVLEGG